MTDWQGVLTILGIGVLAIVLICLGYRYMTKH
jgi:hypothetical protein